MRERANGDNGRMATVFHRYAAFTTSPDGGNPAGVWIGDQLPDAVEMQRIAAEAGLPDTAFICPAMGLERDIRYYSPESEVAFCGHATIATGVILGKEAGAGTYRFSTRVGEIPVVVRQRDSRWEASLTSVVPKHEAAPAVLVADALRALGWSKDSLDPAIPPARVNAGNWHLVIAVATQARLAALDYDFAQLKALMLADGLTTLQLIWRERPDLYHSRNPYPVGGVVEDPASGSAAAAFAGYLRDTGLLAAPATILIRQGETMGRPSRLVVDIPVADGIVVSGNAVPMEN